MKIIYIAHSGFLAETKKAYCLFDYWEGELPEFLPGKPLYVFASHRHADHFSPAVFALAERHDPVCFVLSYDIKLNPFHLKKYGIGEEMLEKIFSVRADEDREFAGFSLHTIKSTDAGVAFLLETEEGVIYHAGDLNWWIWDGQSKQERNNMTANFKRAVEYLRGKRIDAAFVPLDPKQGEYYYMGLEYLMQTADIRHVFPMHCWEDYTVSERFLREGHAAEKGGALMRIRGRGEVFTV